MGTTIQISKELLKKLKLMKVHEKEVKEGTAEFTSLEDVKKELGLDA